MSDRMTPLPFDRLLEIIFEEPGLDGRIFSVSPGYRGDAAHTLPLLGGRMEAPLGPAAGPHTQLAQNIIAAYISGARFFELKTVQTLDGEDLPVAKPCILAEDEGYNVEWSTELTVPQAMDEYIKAWFALKLLARELGLGGADGFLFNMSVGYDYAGISSPKIDAFIEGLKDASHTDIWAACRAAALDSLPRFHNVDRAYIDSISPNVSRSVTLSTLHGCPPQEIERIAAYLLREKGLHTFVKCNPTLLGYETARGLLDSMGYTDLVFDTHHFENDLQMDDAVPMLRRLQELADEHDLTFGVKLTNTFPVRITRGELPGDEMYMSGKSLAPLSLAVAQQLSAAFDGQLRMSYSGGADAFNVGELFAAGIWPITVATTLLKPGGYRRLNQMAKLLSAMPYKPFAGVDGAAVAALLAGIVRDPHHRRPVKPPEGRKLAAKVPLLDCFTAPCTHGCPFGQDIPGYLRLLDEGRARQAMAVILARNPLPNITGTICSHPCTEKCTRVYYDSAVNIRGAKLAAVHAAWEEALDRVYTDDPVPGIHIAVVGGGPAGMACAFLLARRGVDVTLFEASDALGGIVRHVIPAFRIDGDAIDQDARLLDAVGVKIRLNTKIDSAEALLSKGFTHVIAATGAWSPGRLTLAGGGEAVNVLDFLAACKRGNPPTGRHIAVVGGGNAAMDAARAAKRLPGVEHVTLVYRRTAAYMPADLAELELAQAEGVEWRELLAPVAYQDGALTCTVMELGAADRSGRRAPIANGQTVTLSADLVIAAVGERVDGAAMTAHGVTMDFSGKPIVASATLESGTRNLFVAGDARRGPATVAQAIADAHTISEAILGEAKPYGRPAGRRGSATAKKGILSKPVDRYTAAATGCKTRAESFSGMPHTECARCLECGTVCENCVDVCPNRANLPITVLTRRMPQILHIDSLCNECGNCATFCPYDSAPYREKFTLFSTVAAFQDSENPGFVVLDRSSRAVRVRLDGMVFDTSLKADGSPLPSGVQDLMETLFLDYCFVPGL